MTREISAPKVFVARTEALAASIIENTLGEVRSIPQYSDRLIVMAGIEKALRAERDDAYEKMEKSVIDPEAAIRSLVQSFDSQAMAESLIPSEVTARLQELVATGEISEDQAQEVIVRLEL